MGALPRAPAPVGPRTRGLSLTPSSGAGQRPLVMASPAPRRFWEPRMQRTTKGPRSPSRTRGSGQKRRSLGFYRTEANSGAVRCSATNLIPALSGSASLTPLRRQKGRWFNSQENLWDPGKLFHSTRNARQSKLGKGFQRELSPESQTPSPPSKAHGTPSLLRKTAPGAAQPIFPGVWAGAQAPTRIPVGTLPA